MRPIILERHDCGGVRAAFVKVLKERFADYTLTYSIGVGCHSTRLGLLSYLKPGLFIKPPSPAPTLTAIPQTLRSHQSTIGQAAANGSAATEHDGDEGDDEEGPSIPTDNITLIQARLESRIPGLSSVGTL